MEYYDNMDSEKIIVAIAEPCDHVNRRINAYNVEPYIDSRNNLLLAPSPPPPSIPTNIIQMVVPENTELNNRKCDCCSCITSRNTSRFVSICSSGVCIILTLIFCYH